MHLLHQWERLHRVHPVRVLENCRTTLERTVKEMMAHQQNILSRCRLKLQESTVKLDALSPLSVLARGYSIAYRLPEKTMLRDARQVEEKDDILVHLSRGCLRCIVKTIED